ncbi:ABC transporter ATP-binding protein [Paenibacillus campi]|uniref:ABC transporter ATP-binding protein n=1 Tax=Paenibacillus campi TaxID=3106031 RepID=UPI002AFF218F|nr:MULTISPECIES: ABC transporter ATP-binding protein [unclassified Paenibacillus]
MNSNHENISFSQIVQAFKYWPKLFSLFFNVNKFYVICIAILTIFTGISPIISLYLIQSLVNALATPDGVHFNYVALIFASFIGFLFLKEMLSLLHSYLEGIFQSLLTNKLNALILEKAATLGQEDFENAELQDQLKRAQQETSYRPYQIFAQMLSIFTSFITIVSSVLFLLYWKWWLALILVLLPFISFQAFIKLSNYEFIVQWKRSYQNRKLWYVTHLLTHDKAFKEVKTYNFSGTLVEQYKTIVHQFFLQDKGIATRRFKMTALFNLINVAFISVCIYLIIRATYVKEILIGSLVSYIQAVMLVQSTAQSLIYTVINLCQQNMFIEQLFMFLNHSSKDPSFTRTNHDPVQLTDIYEIEFRHVYFAYPGTEHNVLNDLNLVLKRGETYAFIGKNGSGKSTLIKLIAQLYDTYDGEILINGLNIKHYDVQSVRDRVGILFQDFMQYEMSLRENISMNDGGHHANDRLMMAAMHKAGMHEFRHKLPNGLDTQLGKWFPEGQQLSGGQWQRVAIARAFFKNADVCILDEPSAALDPEAEQKVFEQFNDLMTGKIGIFISHRYTSTRMAQKIVYMKQGTVLAEGNHETLLKTCHEYYEFYHIQASAYQEA